MIKVFVIAGVSLNDMYIRSCFAKEGIGYKFTKPYSKVSEYKTKEYK